MTVLVPFRPQAVVFDLDGLLLDSEPVWAAAEAEVVESFGHTWRPEMQRLLLGKGPDDAALALAAHLDGLDVTEVKRRLRAASEAHFRGGVPLRPGAARLVGALAGRLPIGVATNSRRVLADLALASAGLAGRFEAVVTADPKVVLAADKVVLPGVGAFPDCMRNLEQGGFVEPILKVIRDGRPFLGICLGLQLLFDSSTELGGAAGLGLIPGGVDRLDTGGLKLPQIGWNTVEWRRPSSLTA